MPKQKIRTLFFVIVLTCWIHPLTSGGVVDSAFALAGELAEDSAFLANYLQTYGTTSNNPDYQALYDLDNDDDIDGQDIALLLDDDHIPAGNLFGGCFIPADAMAENTSSPDIVIGNGTVASCSSESVVEAISSGGIITFDCGSEPVTITLDETAKVFNNTGPKIVIDGGGKVTLNGDNQRRILFTHNRAVGNGGNPARSGTPGGGSGGAIYNDGNTMTLSLCGSRIEYNEVNEYGVAIFFVSNDHTGNIVIEDTVSRENIGGSWYPDYPGISAHSDTTISVDEDSIIE